MSLPSARLPIRYRLLIAQMPGYGTTDRIKLHMYPGGHMFYARPDSGAALRRDIMAAYGARG